MEKPIYKIENGVEVEVTLDCKWYRIPYAIHYPDKIVIYPNKLAKANAILEIAGHPGEAFERIQKEKQEKEQKNKSEK